MVKIVYFGKKYPKIIQTIAPERLAIEKEKDRRLSAIATKAGKIHSGISFIPLTGKATTYKFSPFEAKEVPDEIAEVLLNKAGDIFKRVDTEELKPDPTPEIKTDGYVGDTPAERIPDLQKTVAKEVESEKGKSLEEIISGRKDKEEEKETKEEEKTEE